MLVSGFLSAGLSFSGLRFFSSPAIVKHSGCHVCASFGRRALLVHHRLRKLRKMPSRLLYRDGGELTFTQYIIAGDSWGSDAIPVIGNYPLTLITFVGILATIP